MKVIPRKHIRLIPARHSGSEFESNPLMKSLDMERKLIIIAIIFLLCVLYLRLTDFCVNRVKTKQNNLFLHSCVQAVF